MAPRLCWRREEMGCGGERNGYASKMENLKVDTNFCLSTRASIFTA